MESIKSITLTSWPLSFAASMMRRVEYKFLFLESIAIFICLSSQCPVDYHAQ